MVKKKEYELLRSEIYNEYSKFTGRFEYQNYNFTRLKALADLKIKVPDLLHFVWIGNVDDLCLDYIRIWEMFNQDKKIYLWLDRDSSLCSFLHDNIEIFCGKDNVEKILKMRNEAFEYIYNHLKPDINFNDLVIDFLINYGIPFSVSDFLRSKNILDHFLVEKNILDLFEGKFSYFKKLYYYELILRNNLACASDIIRLIILYKYGGIYIDVDTLPYFDYIFHKTNSYLDKIGLLDNECVNIIKTESFVSKFKKCSTYTFLNKVKRFIEKMPSTKQEKIRILEFILYDMNHLCLEDLKPLNTVVAYKDLIILSSLNFIEGVFFNNIICSYPESKLVRIILREIKKRYRYIEKNNAVWKVDLTPRNNHETDNSYLLYYRSYNSQYYQLVTLSLTGPQLIFNLILSLMYKILKLDKKISPKFLAQFIQNDYFGIGFTQQTLDTFLGIDSKWRL